MPRVVAGFVGAKHNNNKNTVHRFVGTQFVTVPVIFYFIPTSDVDDILLVVVFGTDTVL